MVRWEGPASVAKVIDLCDGLPGIRTSDRVLVKPNLVGWDNQGPYPPWGVLTTSRLMEGLCAVLKDRGVTRIRIGEGSIACKAIGSGTTEIFQYLGYDKLVQRYGVQLVDFNRGAFDTVELDPGHEVKVTNQVRECDALISVPVLKTHAGTVVTLGMKNLKGLLHPSSKQYCHHPQNLLDHFITRLAETFTPTLTLIDGVYANERGPLHMGFAHRRDLLIASTDVYAADLLGAYVLGYGTDEVRYLKEWSDRHGCPPSLRGLSIRGDVDPDEVRKPLAWDWPWLPDNTGPEAFAKMGIRGLRLPKYDHTLCTGCSYMFNPLMMLLLSTREKTFDDMEILSGTLQEPSGKARKTFLFGQCQVKKNLANPSCGEIVRIRGCPPSIQEMEKALRENGIPADRTGYDQYRRYLMGRYGKKPDLYPFTDFFLGEVPAWAASPPPNPDKQA